MIKQSNGETTETLMKNCVKNCETRRNTMEIYESSVGNDSQSINQ